MLIKSIKKLNTSQDVFDINVADDNSYVLSNGVISHNSGLQYAGSLLVMLSKSKEKEGDDHIGSLVTCTAVKSRLTKEGIKIKTLIRFDGGLDRYYGLIPIAESAGIIKKSGNKFEFEDGTKAFGTRINKKPELFWTEERLKKIDDWVKLNFTYSSGEVDDSLPEADDNDQE